MKFTIAYPNTHIFTENASEMVVLPSRRKNTRKDGTVVQYYVGYLNFPEEDIDMEITSLLLEPQNKGEQPSGYVFTTTESEQVPVYGFDKTTVKRRQPKKGYFRGIAFFPGDWVNKRVLILPRATTY